ncbi:hypothetical protein [Desulfovibrio sp. UCD-KL4C]|uniref:hypothetical protein n=1 Tax=Desulfovibrio sp. UCD-KL4C TaxID=2578120 RepID=UPI0025C5BD33|nr:hypothetical protein [Desulfovibrio sp. UCD-KL4C]
MNTITPSPHVEGTAQDAGVIPVNKLERTDIANSLHGPALRAHEADQATEAATVMNRITGKGTIIDQMI